MCKNFFCGLAIFGKTLFGRKISYFFRIKLDMRSVPGDIISFYSIINIDVCADA